LFAQGLEPPEEHGLDDFGHGQDDLPDENLTEMQREQRVGAETSDAEWLKMENHGLEERHFADLSPDLRRKLSPYFVRPDAEQVVSRSGPVKHVRRDTQFFRWTKATDNFYGSLLLFEHPSTKDELWIPVRREEAVMLGLSRPEKLGITAIRSALEIERGLKIFGSLRRPPAARWQVIDAYYKEIILERRRQVIDLYDTMHWRDSDRKRVKSDDRLDLARKIRTQILHPLIRTIGDYQEWEPTYTRQVLQVLDYTMLHPGAGSQEDRKRRTIKPLLKDVITYLEDVGKIFQARKKFAKAQPDHPVFVRMHELAKDTFAQPPAVQ
jgi:hypothetical protein